MHFNGGGVASRKCWDINPFTITTPIICTRDLDAAVEGCHFATGATAVGQVGYRWQSAAWVFGVEAQGNWVDLSCSNVSQNVFFAGSGVANRSRIGSIGSVHGTGRIFLDHTILLYENDFARHVAHDYIRQLPDHGVRRSSMSTLSCGAVVKRDWGGMVRRLSIEYAFSPKRHRSRSNTIIWAWRSRKVGKVYDPALFGAALANHSDRVRQDIDMVTLRLNYRFGGPVIAKY